MEAIHAPYAWQFWTGDDVAERAEINIGLIDVDFDGEHQDLQFEQLFWNDTSTAQGGHGTHVAGIFAAGFDNGLGVTGVYPLAEGHLYGVSNTDMTGFALKAALAELIVRDVKVINYSMGYADDLIPFLAAKGYQDYQWLISYVAAVIEDFLERMLDKGYDFVIVAAAGNGAATKFRQAGQDGDEYHGWEKTNAAFSGETSQELAGWRSGISAIGQGRVRDHVIVVGNAALDGNTGGEPPFYKLASRSDGGDRVDVMAPGTDIWSTIPGNGYTSKSGTSQAAPHVSGVAALVWSFNPTLTGAQVKNIVVKSGSPSSQEVEGTSLRLVDANKAISLAAMTTGASQSDGTQNGVVISAVTGPDEQRLDKATVEVLDAQTGDVVSEAAATTDGDGRFELILPAGTYTLRASAEGYNDQTTDTITVETGQVLYLAWIELEPLAGTTSNQDSFDQIRYVAPPDGLAPQGEFGTHRYRVFQLADSDDFGPLRFDYATRYCLSLGGHLATIASAEEDTAVYQYIISQGVASAYFGLTQAANSESWGWLTFEPFLYRNWALGEPNNEDGVEAFGMYYWKYDDGKWNDGDFTEMIVDGGSNFVCEWDSADAYDTVASQINPIGLALPGYPPLPVVDRTNWIIYDEGYRSDRREVAFFDVAAGTGAQNIVWDESLELTDPVAHINSIKFYLDTDTNTWIEFETDYPRISDWGTAVYLSTMRVVDAAGDTVLEPYTG
jgi:hypothetical protein